MLHAGTNLERLKVDSMIFRPQPFSSWDPKLYLKHEFMNWADFLNADSDAIIFG